MGKKLIKGRKKATGLPRIIEQYLYLVKYFQLQLAQKKSAEHPVEYMNVSPQGDVIHREILFIKRWCLAYSKAVLFNATGYQVGILFKGLLLEAR